MTGKYVIIRPPSWKRSAWIWIVLTLFLYPASAGAQVPALRVYSIEDGLKYPQVFTVYQDSRGFLWVGTSYGLGRYDGRKFINFTKATGLPHDSVRQVIEDAEGLIWAITQDGMITVNPQVLDDPAEALQPVPASLPASCREGTPLAARHGEDLWLVCQRQLVRIHNWQPETVAVVPELDQEKIRSFAFDPNGVPWVMTNRHAAAWLDGEWQRLDQAAADGEENVALRLTKDGFYLLRGDGLYRYDGRDFRRETPWDFPPETRPIDFLPYRDALVLLTHSNGIYLMERDKPARHFWLENGFPTNDLNGGMVDRDGLLWLASENGLIKLTNFSLLTYRLDRTQAGNFIFSFAAAPAGGIWIGHAGGVSHLAEGQEPRAVYNQESVWSLLALGDGSLLAGTESGLVRLENGRAERYADLPLLGKAHLYDLHRDRTGRIWATTLDGLASFAWDEAQRRPRDVRIYQIPDGLPINEVRAISESADGTLWFGTDGGGVVRWRDGKLSVIGKESGLPTLVCRAVLARPEGVWIGTDLGLFLYADGKVRPLTRINDQLEDSYIAALAEGEDGEVWIADSYNVYRFYDGALSRAVGKLYGLGGQMTTAENGLFFDGQCRLWIGFTNGFSSLDLHTLVRTVDEPAIVIDQVRDRQRRRVHPGDRVSHADNTITFTFLSPTYFAEDLTQFQSYLEGYEDSWTMPQKSCERVYANLPAGSYQLRVRAISAAGRPSAKIGVFPFRIEPPWWRRFWFKFLAAVAGLLIAYSAYRLRTVQWRQRQQQLETLVRQRTTELRQANLRLLEANRKLEELANLDGLTNLLNKRHFQIMYEREWKNALRQKQPLAVLMIDVDCFKAFNDNYGHQAGDDSLQQVAETLRVTVARPADLVARYGGEEFIVVLSDTPQLGAGHLAETIRARIEALGIEHRHSSAAAVVTVSIGVAGGVPDAHSTPDELVQLADRLLYQAKQKGRNQVRIAS